MYSVNLKVTDLQGRLTRLPLAEVCRVYGSVTGYRTVPKTEKPRFYTCPDCGCGDFREGGYINWYECDNCACQVMVVIAKDTPK